MENHQIKQIILRELPGILQRDPEVQEFIVRLSRQHFADKAETASRFDRLLEELRRDREEQARKWDEQEQRWQEMQGDLRARWEEQARKWDEQARRWEEQESRWQAQERKWEENQKIIRQMLADIQALSRKHDSTIGALGARWGLSAEQSFRSALQGILQDTFGVQVISVIEYDDAGEVFGRPDQVELDLIIKDGMLIICEIKSSVSKGDMYLFERKARFYEKKHQRQASRLLVISPMVDKAARSVAARLDIQVYSYAEEVDSTIFGG